MAAVREYGYYIKGNKLSIVEKDTTFDNDPNSRDYGPGSDRSQWKSPKESVSSGIEIEYSLVEGIDNIQDEDYELDLPLYLQKALIYYMKAKSFEDVLDFEKSEYFMSKFRKQVEILNNSKVSGVRIVAPGPFSIK